MSKQYLNPPDETLSLEENRLEELILDEYRVYADVRYKMPKSSLIRL